MNESVETLQATERQCLARFRSKAASIRAAHPELTPQIAFCRAVEALPKTASKYQYIRSRLGLMGVAALPLR